MFLEWLRNSSIQRHAWETARIRGQKAAEKQKTRIQLEFSQFCQFISNWWWLLVVVSTCVRCSRLIKSEMVLCFGSWMLLLCKYDLSSSSFLFSSSSLLHAASGKPTILLNILAVPGPKLHSSLKIWFANPHHHTTTQSKVSL